MVAVALAMAMAMAVGIKMTLAMAMAVHRGVPSVEHQGRDSQEGAPCSEPKLWCPPKGPSRNEVSIGETIIGEARVYTLDASATPAAGRAGSIGPAAASAGRLRRQLLLGALSGQHQHLLVLWRPWPRL